MTLGRLRLKRPQPTKPAAFDPPPRTDRSGAIASSSHPTTDELLALRDRLVAEASNRLDASDIPGAAAALRQLESATTDERTLELTDPFLPALLEGRSLVASFDPQRKPREGEVVVIYGNYPHAFENVVVNNPIKRHVADFWRFAHEHVEHDPRWDAVELILIINRAKRLDRYDAVLRELAAARAPLHRVTRIDAVPPDNARLRRRHPYATLAQIACLSSHIAALRAAQVAQVDNFLVLEDDFCFTSDLDQHLDDLGTFFDRHYDYLICLLGTSKYGAVVAFDELLCQSFQACTNAEGYLVSRAGLEVLLPVTEHALTMLRASGDIISWAIDRCWSTLQPSGKFFVFRRKFGFQAASLSDIEQTISRYLD
jgi:hypothetical protein